MKTAASRHGSLAGGGEMGALIRAFDWSVTAVGAPPRWSSSLRTALGILLNSRHPMFLWWGSDLTQFYNDAYRPSLGADRHPRALGARGREFWADIWPTIGPEIEGVMDRGESTWHHDHLVPIFRNGRLEEVYWTYGYSPVHDDDGHIGGTLVVVQEQTARVLGERRLRALRDLAALASLSYTESEVWTRSAAVLRDNPNDLPMVLLYRLIDGDPRIVGTSDMTVDSGTWPIHDVVASGQPLLVTDVRARVGDVRVTTCLEPIEVVWVAPLRRPGSSSPYGVLVAGISPRLPFDAEYSDFMSLAADHIANCITSARAHEEERQRAESLAELDRAKTSFFSNVSHEFRTPLTLMLGPTEQALTSPDRSLCGVDLELVHGNQLRLLKLVNALLDFACLEAGRAEAVYEPTDLAALTADVASAFRSMIEHAGLRFEIDCSALSQQVAVDRDMWAKIVSNLLSNAFKFTLDGCVGISLRERAGFVELVVHDTGVGIAAEELPRVFERFHRVPNRKGRTNEGSGIGLALLHELVQMHKGTVHATSVQGEGTTFTVAIPVGTRSLDGRDPILAARSTALIGSVPYVEEARRWSSAPPAWAGDPVARVPQAFRSAGDAEFDLLIVEDNADMRDYLRRLLEAKWHVDVAEDGLDALAAARRRRPDLIVSDVMMPALDGIGFLRELRLDADLRTIPVILLTARAGEGARIDGWNAGADDYLVKPFSSRELVARVEAQLVKGRLRTVEEQQARRLAAIFEHAPVGIATLRGPDHVFEFANPPYLELLANRAIVGKPIREALPELAHQAFYALLDQVYQSGIPYIGRGLRVMLNRGETGATEENFFDFVYQPTLDEHHRVDGVVVVAYEVSELTRARHAAEAANRVKELALETAHLGAWRLDLTTLELENSARDKGHFGVAPDAPFSYDSVVRAIHPDDRQRVLDAFSYAVTSGADYAVEYRVVWPDGTTHWLTVRGRTLDASAGPARYMAGNTRDVTDEKRLVDDLRRSRDELEQRVAERTSELQASNFRLAHALKEQTAFETARSEWLRTLMTAQEDERRRVARELHDEMGQHLSALSRDLDGLTSSDPTAAMRLAAHVAEIERGVRRLARDLRPAALDDLGLVTALTTHVEEWSKQHGIAADFCSRHGDRRLPSSIESTLYRIVQEALTNVVRHARAQNVSVVLEQSADHVTVIIEDDGRGFAADSAALSAGSLHFGLRGIRERAALLGGTLTIESSTGATSIFVNLPLSNGHSDAMP